MRPDKACLFSCGCFKQVLKNLETKLYMMPSRELSLSLSFLFVFMAKDIYVFVLHPLYFNLQNKTEPIFYEDSGMKISLAKEKAPKLTYQMIILDEYIELLAKVDIEICCVP